MVLNTLAISVSAAMPYDRKRSDLKWYYLESEEKHENDY